MNKAFIKEDEAAGSGHCPRCEAAGIPVGKETLDAFVPAAARSDVAETGYFCPTHACDVVYFDDFDRVVERATIPQPVYPKDLDAPICGCFGFSNADIEEDIEEGTPRRVRELLARTETPEARCAIKNPSGQCCAFEVRRMYMKRREETSKS